jgi:hypothetical protein
MCSPRPLRRRRAHEKAETLPRLSLSLTERNVCSHSNGRQHIYGAAESHAEKAGNTSRTSKVVVRIASSKVIVPKAMSQTK